MKATVEWYMEPRLYGTAYESGDQPPDAVDIPPALLNEWQKARLALTNAEGAILSHLSDTDQRLPRRQS